MALAEAEATVSARARQKIRIGNAPGAFPKPKGFNIWRQAGRLPYMQQSKKLLRLACIAALFYTLLVLANALLTYSWLGDKVELGRGLVRFFGFSAIAIMAMRGEKWSERFLFWGSLIWAIFGMMSMVLVVVPDALAERPYPMADKAFLILSTFSLITTFTLAWMARKKKKEAIAAVI